MTKQVLTIDGQTIPYQVTKRRGSRAIRLSLGSDGVVKVSVPWFVRTATALEFVKVKAGWIGKRLHELEEQKKRSLIPGGHHSQYVARAKKLITEKLRDYNKHYQFTYQRVSIRNQSSRWGSCSKDGNLNFNYRLLFLEEALVDYVVVHELCHLAEMNHGARFWKLVEETIPDYAARRRRLRAIHI